jgi:hypothetical protein
MIYSTVDCPFRYIFSKAGRVVRAHLTGDFVVRLGSDPTKVIN